MCKQCGESSEDDFVICWNCGTSVDGGHDENFEVDTDEMLVGASTTSGVQSREDIGLYTTDFAQGHDGDNCDLITGVGVVSIRSFNDLVEQKTAYRNAVKEAQDLALDELRERASMVGAKAVRGISFSIAFHNQIAVVSANGTAICDR